MREHTAFCDVRWHLLLGRHADIAVQARGNPTALHTGNCEAVTRPQAANADERCTNGPIRLGADRIGRFLGTYAADAVEPPPQAVNMLYLCPRLLLAFCYCCTGLFHSLLQQRQAGQ